MKAVRQARLELSGGTTPDQLKPPNKLWTYISESCLPPPKKNRVPWGSLKRSAHAVQLFGCLAVLETHTLRY